MYTGLSEETMRCVLGAWIIPVNEWTSYLLKITVTDWLLFWLVMFWFDSWTEKTETLKILIVTTVFCLEYWYRLLDISFWLVHRPPSNTATVIFLVKGSPLAPTHSCCAYIFCGLFLKSENQCVDTLQSPEASTSFFFSVEQLMHLCYPRK